MSQQHVDQQVDQQQADQQLTQEQQDEQEFAQALDEAFGDSHGEGDDQLEQQQEAQEGLQGDPDTSREDPAEQTPPVPSAVQTEKQSWLIQPRFRAPEIPEQPLPPDDTQPPSTPQAQVQPQPDAPKRLEVVPEHIAGELEELRKINPAAADLAMEDSPEGEGIRARLEDGGKYAAEDRAELIFSRRNAAVEAAKREEAAAHQRVIDQHNAYFRDVIRNEVPEYFALCNDPNRKAEYAQYQQDILNWIRSKPYAEGEALMQIAQHGRDPRDVCNLIRTFEREKAAAKQTSKRPDPTAALAVPGRGAPVAPTGVGDRDDFDAGLDAALSSYR